MHSWGKNQRWAQVLISLDDQKYLMICEMQQTNCPPLTIFNWISLCTCKILDGTWTANISQQWRRKEEVSTTHNSGVYTHTKPCFPEISTQSIRLEGAIRTWNFSCLSDQGLQTPATHHRFCHQIGSNKAVTDLIYCFLEAYQNYFLIAKQV